MTKQQIKYYDPRLKGVPVAPDGSNITIIANTEAEKALNDEIIHDPERGITIIEDWHEAPPDIGELYAELDELDKKIVRPLSEMMNETATDEDNAKFAELMLEKRKLRDTIHELLTPKKKKK